MARSIRVLGVPLGALNLPGAFGSTAAELIGQLQILASHALTGAGTAAGTPARRPGRPRCWRAPGPRSPRSPEADRLRPAAVRKPTCWRSPTGTKPAAARRAWLAARLPALQAGHLTLAQLP